MTYPLHLNISDDLEKEIKAFASAYGINVSAAVRILLRQALDAERYGRQPKEITR